MALTQTRETLPKLPRLLQDVWQAAALQSDTEWEKQGFSIYPGKAASLCDGKQSGQGS